MTQALRPGKPAARKRLPAKTSAARPKVAATIKLPNGFTAGIAGALRYRLFVPPGVRQTGGLPLMVMLHGCSQTAEAFATSTRMNQIAAKEGFAVLYPEQNKLANLQGCWNWHQTSSGKGQTEADAIFATILQVCQRQVIDPRRIALAGLSAGASMAALLAVRHPALFRAVAMHSGVAPGMAHSLAGALKAMRGHSVAVPLSPLLAGTHLPALLVIQGSADHWSHPATAARQCNCGPRARPQNLAGRVLCSVARATPPPSPTTRPRAGWWPPCATSRGWATPGAVASPARLTATPKARTPRA